MRRSFVILCFLAALSAGPISNFATPRAAAQGAVEPWQEEFVQGFLLVRKAEDEEKQGKLKDALANYKTAAARFNRVRQTWPQWEPDVVNLRLQRTNESIARLEKAMGGVMDAPPAEPPGVLPPLPGTPADLGPLPGDLPPVPEVPNTRPGVPKPPKGTQPKPVVKTGIIIQDLSNQMNALETQLAETQEQLKREQEQSQALEKELATAVDARTKAEAAAKKAAELSEVYQTQMLEARTSDSRGNSRVQELEKQLADSKKHLDAARTDLAAATEREEQLSARAKVLSGSARDVGTLRVQLEAEKKKTEALATQVGTVTKERDDARLEIVKLKDLNKQADKLMADNASLLKKLGDAERQIMTFKSDAVDKDRLVADLQKQITDAQKALTASTEKNTKLTADMGDLQKKMTEYSKQIGQLKSAASGEEQKKLADENRLLQGIVMRVLQEDANRAQRKKMLQKEIEKLNVNSDVLLKQISFLSQPVVKLSAEERRLFKRPELTVQDPNTLVAVLPNNSAPANPPSNPPSNPPAPETPTPDAPPKPAGTKTDDLPKSDTPPPQPEEMKPEQLGNTPPPPASNVNTGAAGLPADVQPLAKQAKTAFDGERYADAEKLYDKALQLAPNNLYLLTHRGITQFRSNKLKQAEDTFRKALAIAPEDHSSWCTLGVVYYSQGKYDEAVNSLTKSLAINSKNALAHNYLGITAAEKGWMEAALKELDTAIQLDPKYADAWFNLAVVYATKEPVNKAEATRCYKKAIELGSDADPRMEKVLNN